MLNVMCLIGQSIVTRIDANQLTLCLHADAYQRHLRTCRDCMGEQDERI